ncbi:MAG: IS110 family transposase [Chloroflexi bacterium]|nr:IS110 family transposase [Chloroflexota bacterium]
MQNSLTHIGLDVHQRSISVAVLRAGASRAEEDQIPNDPAAIRKLVSRWGDPAGLRVCYEAGPCGYGLQRQLASFGIDCQVIAPALIPRRAGDRVKTDRRDALKLARLHRAGELTAVKVPSTEDEAVRDLLRLREDLGEDVLRSRHRLSKFLLRHDRLWSGGESWTHKHVDWIRSQHFTDPALERSAGEHLEALELRLRQRDELTRELERIAALPPYALRVGRLACLRGVKALTALTLLVEVGDFRRFESAPSFMAFTGLVPSEHSSGESHRRGAITKTGNAHLRRVLVEAAWAYRVRPRHASATRRAGQPAALVAHAFAADRRLHARYWRLVERKKRTTVAAVAVARELAGFVWAVMREPA